MVWVREEAICFKLTEQEGGRDLLGESVRGTRGLDPKVSTNFSFFSFLDFPDGSCCLFMKLDGCLGSQSIEKSEMSTPWLARSYR